MDTTLRALRLGAEDVTRQTPSRIYTKRDWETHDAIVETCCEIFAKWSVHRITLSNMALAMRLTSQRFRRFFPDLESVLAHILEKHLRECAETVAGIPAEMPDRRRRQRAAYFSFTRKPLGGFTSAHTLLVQQRHLLPPDLLKPIEAAYRSLGEIMGGRYPDHTLDLLECLAFNAEDIERFMPLLERPEVPPDDPESASPALRVEPPPPPPRLPCPSPPPHIPTWLKLPPELVQKLRQLPPQPSPPLPLAGSPSITGKSPLADYLIPIAARERPRPTAQQCRPLSAECERIWQSAGNARPEDAPLH